MCWQDEGEEGAITMLEGQGEGVVMGTQETKSLGQEWSQKL